MPFMELDDDQSPFIPEENIREISTEAIVLRLEGLRRQLAAAHEALEIDRERATYAETWIRRFEDELGRRSTKQ